MKKKEPKSDPKPVAKPASAEAAQHPSLSLQGQEVVLVLDTNVFMAHVFNPDLLDRVDGLKESLDKLVAVFPEVVEKECKEHFANSVRVKSHSVEPHGIRDELAKVSKHIDAVLQKAHQKWLARVLKSMSRLQASPAVLRGAMDRAISKRPPCHEREEFRDAVLWETVLSLAGKGKTVLFITNNTKDFPFGENKHLDGEADKHNIRPFRTFKDLADWLVPLKNELEKAALQEEGPELPPVGDFAAYYAALDLEDSTRQALEDELPERLMSVTEYFDSDAEVFDLEREDFDISDVKTGVPGLLQYIVEEKWTFSVSFGLSGSFRAGGSDGVDLHASGHGEARGTAHIRRDITITDGDVEEKVTIEKVDLDYDDDWNPYDAYASDRD